VDVVTQVLVPLVAGASGGAVASLVTPWAQWGVDKRRERRAAQVKIIQGARTLVAREQDRSRSEILRDPRYLAIRPHLRPAVEEQLRAQTVIATSDPYGTTGNPYLALIRNEADRLEREWDLL
jgi:hypothetical protein